MDYEEAKHAYLHDAQFHHLVDGLAALMADSGLTTDAAHHAVDIAFVRAEMRKYDRRPAPPTQEPPQ